MLFKGSGFVEIEPDRNEPVMRSCWECNLAHEHLKKVNMLHVCFQCGRYWVFDKFLNGFESEAAFDKFFEELGLKPGDSTTTIDAGYRVMQITIEPAKGGNA